MKTRTFIQTSIASTVLIAAAAMFSGCETTNSSAPSPGASSVVPAATAPTGAALSHIPEQYRTSDGRDISIGHATADNGGWRFREPHLDKCWIANGFNFTGYDTIYIAPTLSTAKFHDDENAVHELAKQNIVTELTRSLAAKGLFPNVVVSESAIKPNSHVLKVEITILEFAKGGGAARYFVGLYGGGQPKFKLQGKMTDGDKTEFNFEARRSGVSADARLGGVAMKDEDIQLQDIRSFVLDLTDFMAAVAGKYTPRS